MADDTSDRAQRGGETQTDPQAGQEFLVIGLGASAGGIHALKEFFTRVGVDSGMAYVVILHMSPEHESQLAQVLQVVSRIPVTQVNERVRIEPNHVYVIPPSQNLLMTEGHLALSPMTNMDQRRSPVDTFFRTLAENSEERAISVVLSGTGSNGSIGIKRIKEHGGVAFAQDPGEAEYQDMPRSAIATGLVDYVLPVADIPAKIISYKEHFDTVQISIGPETPPANDEEALLDILNLLKGRTGHDFLNYKRATMLRRIERRVGVRELDGLRAYAGFLRQHPKEAGLLLKDLLISVTNFFRDSESLRALETKILPKVFEHKGAEGQVRAWVVGCATGEEAYSIAMLLAEAADTRPVRPGMLVFASDLDRDAVAKAREGHYTEAEVADISPERLHRFLRRETGGYRISKELREMMLFAEHNVIRDPPFSHLDLLSCRNLLIYLNRTAQHRVLEVFHFALNPGGYLLLGSSESVDGSGDLFAAADKDHHIYQSREAAPRAALPVSEPIFQLPRLGEGIRVDAEPERRPLERLSYADLHQRLLEQYAPPSVVVNENHDIVHLSERAGKYLQLVGGEPSHNLLAIVRPELRLDLRTSLLQAKQNGADVEARDLRVQVDERIERINLIVRPVLREQETARGFFLVIFEPLPEGESPLQEMVRPVEPVARQLEDDLSQSRAQLRSVVEQYEVQHEELKASNEELQASNEELRSSAEELETSKEELQSLNEELTTVNQELKIKIEELSQSNNDFRNLMNSTDIGTIFVDRSLQVKLFTPRARDVFNLIPTDTGRSLLDITNKLLGVELVSDVRHVLETLTRVEREVQTQDEHWYMMQLSPYRTTEDRIDGVVITLIDINERKHADKTREELEVSVGERTSDLAEANQALQEEISERSQLEDARMQLLGKIVRTQEEERRRIALDLHDELGQQLTALRLKLNALQERTTSNPTMAKTISEIDTIARKIDADVEFLAWELRPVTLDDLGLAAALENYVKQWSQHFNITAHFHAAGFGDQRLSVEAEGSLYRIAQEALNNAAKHAQAGCLDIILELRENHAVLIIEDDGVGFTPAGRRIGEQLGLIGMRERAALLGGDLEIETAPNQGTTIFARVPLNAQEHGNE